MRFLGLAVLSLTLAGCGQDGTEFSVQFPSPPATVRGAIGAMSLAEAGGFFPEAKMTRTEPGSDEVLYTIKGDSEDKSSRVSFQFAPVSGGHGTQVNVKVDVPHVSRTINGRLKYLSEAKVATGMHQELAALSSALAAGKPGTGARNSLRGIMLAIAISTNEKAMARALNEDGISGRLAGLIDGDSDGPTLASGPTAPPTWHSEWERDRKFGTHEVRPAMVATGSAVSPDSSSY